MASVEEVESYLKDLKVKMGIFGIVFRDRDKNLQALADMDISPKVREAFIQGLTSDNYSSGPHNDTETPMAPEYYVFGITIDSLEIYIKMNRGIPGKPVQCISFHPSEHCLTYPLRL